MRDVDVGGRGGEIQMVSGIPNLHAVVDNDSVGQQRRPPGHVHLAGTDRLIGESVWRTTWDWRGNTKRI